MWMMCSVISGNDGLLPALPSDTAHSTALLETSGTGHRAQGTGHRPMRPMRIHRWSERLQKYNFTPQFIPGRENVVADLLTRAISGPSPDPAPDATEPDHVQMLHTPLQTTVSGPPAGLRAGPLVLPAPHIHPHWLAPKGSRGAGTFLLCERGTVMLGQRLCSRACID